MNKPRVKGNNTPQRSTVIQQHQFLSSISNMRTIATFTASLCLLKSTNAFQYGSLPSQHKTRSSPTSRGMKSPSSSTERDDRTRVRFEQAASPQMPFIDNDGRSRKTSLSVATLADSVERNSWLDMMSGPENNMIGSDEVDAVTKVLSASLLVTSNTVGPSMFTLPDAVGGVGVIWGSAIFVGKRAVLLPSLRWECHVRSDAILLYRLSFVHIQPHLWPTASRCSDQDSRIIRMRSTEQFQGLCRHCLAI